MYINIISIIQKFPRNKQYYKKFTESEISENLDAQFSNLLVKDPLVI